MASHPSPFAKALDRGESEPALGELAQLRSAIDQRLSDLLPVETKQPASLHKAMRYSLLGPGKRVRPIMSCVVCEALGHDSFAFALDAGCAVEMVHTASLILDDLPCMDDAGQRRGRTTTHIAFGEATAILASIGLMNRAYEVLAQNSHADDVTKTLSQQILAASIGSDGLVAGQEIDLHERASFDDCSPIEGLNWLKTGVLFVASAELGAVAGGASSEQTHHIKAFARNIGLAFQTADDLMDVTVDAGIMGKDALQDVEKPTLVSIAGVKAARKSCDEHLAAADKSLIASGVSTEKIRALVQSIFGN